MLLSVYQSEREILFGGFDHKVLEDDGRAWSLCLFLVEKWTQVEKVSQRE